MGPATPSPYPLPRCGRGNSLQRRRITRGPRQRTASRRCAASRPAIRTRRSTPIAVPWRAMPRCTRPGTASAVPAWRRKPTPTLPMRLRRAVALRPDADGARCNLAEALFQLGEVDAAVAEYLRAADSGAAEVREHRPRGRRLHCAGRDPPGQFQCHGRAAALDRVAGAWPAPCDGGAPLKRDASCGSAISGRSSARATG